MKPLFFQYISESKIEMLYSQFQSGNGFISEFAPKIGLSGFQVELGIKKELDSRDP